MSSLSFTIDDGVATLGIECARTRNAIDLSIVRALHGALDRIQKGDSGARAVVITGSGAVFSSGVDLHSVDLRVPEARQRAHFEMRRFLDPLILRLSGFRYPIVAAVNGAAVGAGMSLALACDILVMAEDALLMPAFAHLGLVPDGGVTFELPRRVGSGRSLAALLLAESIDAPTAILWGLAYKITPAADILQSAHRIAQRLARGPSAVLAQIRALHVSTFDHSLPEQLRAERSAQEMNLQAHDCVEGVRAFFEKREPNFGEYRG